ncbi:MAG: NAD-dependent epimerase/dehydratase family protein [Ignavibacteriae bacterium]|jgi:nucleoside-diphosphate-sugar epimerase|nr:NAD-dependent epimerase/dehydratase family protein [Ignavibacteriota bacterium]
MEKILIIGAAGQIGSELTMALRSAYGNDDVYATDIKQAPADVIESGPFQILDVMNEKNLIHFIIRNKITQVYHLAAVLSGNAEKLPLQAWEINMRSMLNVLDLGREIGLKKIFWPSSIAVFGLTTPRINTPQLTVMEPNTVYGISKQAGERWCEYYYRKYGLDIRSIRYPGLISYKTEAGGGTTDYAVEIFYEAVKHKKYECFLKEDATLPMMFMPDAIDSTIKLMECAADKISIRSSYNLGGISFNPNEIAAEIKKHIPEFQISYEPDFRQKIAESWPQSIDDSVARKDWGCSYSYDLEKMTAVMLKEIRKKI